MSNTQEPEIRILTPFETFAMIVYGYGPEDIECEIISTEINGK